MNIKLETNKITFKISEEELTDLLNGFEVQLSSPFLSARIKCADKTRLAFTQAQFIFDIAQDDIQVLMDMGRNRNGLTLDQNGNCIVLQVDVRGDKRRAPSSIQPA